MSTLGWIAIAVGGLIVIDTIAEAEKNVQRFGPNPQAEAEQEQNFAQGSDQAKQDVVQNMYP